MLLSALVFLCPLGVYCFLLGRINRRRHPVLVAGVQDCAGLLLALSGFFLVVVPGILTGFHYRPGDVWLYYHYHALPGLGHRWAFIGWAFVWLVYATVILGLAGWMLARRRWVSVVYNVEPATFDKALGHVLDRLGYGWTRRGRCLWVDVRRPAAKAAGHDTVPAPHHAPWAAHVLAGARQAGEAGRETPPLKPEGSPDYRDMDMLLEVESWAALRHVTLTWAPGSDPLRREVEAALRQALANVWTVEHSVGLWFQTASALVFLLMFFLTVLYQYLSMLGGRVGV